MTAATNEAKSVQGTDGWRDSEASRAKLLELFDMLVEHSGFGEMHISMKILKHGKKEIILSCGRDYRFVLQPKARPTDSEKGEEGDE